MSEDTPTQRLSEPDPESGGGAPKSKTLLITLISVGGALLLAVIVLLVVLLTSGSGNANETLPTPSTSDASLSPTPTPSVSEESSPTPTPSPSATEEPEETPAPPPPPSNDPKINSFTINNKTNPVVQCNAESPVESHQYLLVKWSSSNVDQVYFGVGTNDASTGALFQNLPPSGNSNDDFEDGYNNGSYEFPCPGTASQKYTLTVIGNGQKVSKSVTVVNQGD